MDRWNQQKTFWSSIVIILFSVSTASCQTDSSSLYDLETRLGRVTGVEDVHGGISYFTFLGIPYARPPVGNLRLAKPEARGPFGVHNGTVYGNQCPANINEFGDVPIIGGDEDCLVLNIQTRLNMRRKKPVMVWIHGGGFQTGTANQFPGDAFVSGRDVVYVAINYRLGLLGFPPVVSDDIPANLGLWDQHMALKWVRDNIEDYGGDKESITIFGVSAGGSSVLAQMLSPLNDRSIFQRAISQSAVFPIINPIVRDPVTFPVLAAALGCTNSTVSEQLTCVRSLNQNTFVLKAFQPNVPPVNLLLEDGFFNPNVLEDIAISLADVTGQTKPVSLQHFGQYDLMIGMNNDDGLYATYLAGSLPFVNLSQGISDEAMRIVISEIYLPNVKSTANKEILVNAFIAGYRRDVTLLRGRQLANRTEQEINLEILKQFTGDMLFAYTAAEMMKLHHLLSVNTGTYGYEYTHRRSWPGFWSTPEFLRVGADHADELPLLFGAYKLGDIGSSLVPADLSLISFLSSINFTNEERELGDVLIDYWQSFVEQGKPESPAANRNWPEYTDAEYYAQIGTTKTITLQRLRQNTINLITALDQAEQMSSLPEPPTPAPTTTPTTSTTTSPTTTRNYMCRYRYRSRYCRSNWRFHHRMSHQRSPTYMY